MSHSVIPLLLISSIVFFLLFLGGLAQFCGKEVIRVSVVVLTAMVVLYITRK